MNESEQAQDIERVRTAIVESLKDCRMRHVQIDDESHEGLPLVDMLTPEGKNDISFGLEEIENIADHLVDTCVGEIVDSQAQKISELTTENNGRALAMELQKSEIERLQNGKTIGSLHHQIASLEVKVSEQAKEIEGLKDRLRFEMQSEAKEGI